MIALSGMYIEALLILWCTYDARASFWGRVHIFLHGRAYLQVVVCSPGPWLPALFHHVLILFRRAKFMASI